jgi:hypothetical protein
VQRYLARTQIGTGFTWDVAIEEIELLPANQLRIKREFSLNFPELTAAAPVAGAAPGAVGATGQDVGEAAKRVRDLFKRRK